jgi:hypothetical protein|tara:strand:- start:3853 stop:4083 length:231 start_codon:yes stop_codon:yes gene_type:complete
MSDNKYIYKRKDGGEIWCYGKFEKDCSYGFSVVCNDEDYDFEPAIDLENPKTNSWYKICKMLDETYRGDIEQITIG